MRKKRRPVFLDLFNANRKRNGNALSNMMWKGEEIGKECERLRDTTY